MYVGIDVGTSMTKAAAFDEGGVLQAVEAQPTVLDSPRDGWFEQDPDEVVRSVVAVVSRVVRRLGAAPRVFGITGQGDGIWLVDDAGHPVRPAVSWMDARASEIVSDWLSRGVVEAAFRRTGNVMFPGAPAPALAWLDANEPRSLDVAATAGYCKDVVMQRFTGVRATDASDASLPFLDPRSRAYDDTVLELCGLSHRKELLAPVADPRPFGELRADVADEIGIAAGTPVIAGPFDIPACALGSGVDTPGEGHISIGTTLACQVLIDDLDGALTCDEPAGLTLATATPGRWLRAMPAMVGTAVLDWLLGLLRLEHTGLDPLLEQSPPGARGVRCLPYFSPAGERAPFVEPRMRGHFDGMTVQTDAADLVRATCEGIAYAAKHCLEAAGLDGEVAICGGGAKSAVWLQMVADVLDRPVRVAPQPETGARGAVLSALQTSALGADLATWTAPEQVIEPTADTAVRARYAEEYDRYRANVARSRTELEGERT